MNIEYFETDCNYIIYKKHIDTDDKNYIRHNEVCVEFNKLYDGKPERQVKHRNFEDVRDIMINIYEREIKKLQEELEVYKNSANYDQYKELLFKDK